MFESQLHDTCQLIARWDRASALGVTSIVDVRNGLRPFSRAMSLVGRKTLEARSMEPYVDSDSFNTFRALQQEWPTHEKKSSI